MEIFQYINIVNLIINSTLTIPIKYIYLKDFFIFYYYANIKRGTVLIITQNLS